MYVSKPVDQMVAGDHIYTAGQVLAVRQIVYLPDEAEYAIGLQVPNSRQRMWTVYVGSDATFTVQDRETQTV